PLADVLRDGRLSMTTLCELEDVLTDENLDRLVAQAAYKSREDCQRSAAALMPSAESPPLDSVRRAPKRSNAPEATLFGASGATPPLHAVQFQPVAEDDWLLRARLSDRVMNNLRRARELASHVVPDGDWQTVLEAALDCFIAAQERRRAGKTDKPKGICKQS